MLVYDFTDYKAWIKKDIEKNTHLKSYRETLAKAAGCQRTYLSLVLNGSNHLSPDQGAGLCRFWNFDDDATDYFLTLIALERASTTALKRHLAPKLARLRRQGESFTKRMPSLKAIGENLSSLIFHSEWYYIAIFTLLGNKPKHTISTIAARLGLSEGLVQQALRHLSEMELIEQRGSRWVATSDSLAVQPSSAASRLIRAQWRQRAMTELMKERAAAHQSTLMHSLNFRDLAEFQTLCREFVVQIARRSETSLPHNDVYCLNVDFFKV